jgi:transglutaminase-like putative cysteine protease
MRRHAGCLLALLLAAPPAAAGPPVEERWEAALFDGARIGFQHTTVEAVGDGPDRRLRTTVDLDLTLRRQGSAVRLRVEQGTEEAPDGKVVGVFMRQYHDQKLRLELTGRLEDERMHVQVDGGRIDRRLRWSDDIVGLVRRERLWAERKPRPGDRFALAAYEPIVDAVVTLRVVVKEPEEVDVLGTRRTLLRVELTPDKLEAGSTSIQLPPTVLWLDDEFAVVRRRIELDGLGAVLLTRTTREVATAAPTGTVRLPDVGLKALVPLNRTLPRPPAGRSIVYRVTVRGDADPATAFVRDAHQEVREVRGETLELVVHPVRPAPGGKSEAAAEYLGSSHYIPADDPRVKELARKAVGTETDPWRKALRVERWVKDNMHIDNAAPLATAAQTARDLRGDCRHFALLTAALCRAEGVPSRTAIGLVYVEKNRQPYLGFHMWTEVLVDGQWLGLDATLGQGGVGPTHVKVTEHSWHEVQSLTPLLPLNRVLGKVAVEVVRVEE